MRLPWQRADERTLIDALGHRDFVGGLWDEVGELQLEFMVGQGLEPSHVFLDVACGSLRGGVHFVRYLEPGRYLGIDKSAELVQAGKREELGERLVRERAPEFVISSRFDFRRFSKCPDFALAQSLFTHLTPTDIRRCLGNLRRFVSGRDCRFYATFLEVDEPVENDRRSHSLVNFHYTADQLSELGARTGWSASYIGEWGHPRGQRMIMLLPD